MTYFVLNVT